MTIIGLTGGIASGKSTAARMFASLGAPLLDADQVSRQVVVPGTPGYLAVLQTFGDTLTYADGTSAPLTRDGAIDRKALGRLVFENHEKLRLLEQTLHPFISEEVATQLAALEKTAPYVIYENAVLVEHGTYKNYSALIVVTVPFHVQKQRVMKRNNLTEAEALSRIAAQADTAVKVRVADYVIYNDGDESSLLFKVQKLHQTLMDRFGKAA